MATRLNHPAVLAALLLALPTAAQEAAPDGAPPAPAVQAEPAPDVPPVTPAPPATPAAPRAGAEAAVAGGIAGVAIDVATGKPVVGALVQLTGPALAEPRTILSGDGGAFSAPDLPAGAYAVAVTRDGYQPFQRQAVAVKPGETVRLGAWLTPVGADVQEVVVTGSRIRRKDVTSAAPVTIIDQQQIQESGLLGLGELLQRLPEQGTSRNAQNNYGNDGEVNVSLRSLGSKRTLVLVNGRRWIAGGPGGAEGLVDLDTIPLAAVDHIEILKDGASAIYGSDAIAGVVNVILKKKFEGTQLSAEGGRSSRGDAQSAAFTGSTGITGERGSVFFSLGYQEQRPVRATARGFSRDPLGYDWESRSSAKTGSYLTANGDILIDDATCAGDPGTMKPALRQACQDHAATGAVDFTYDPTTRSYRPIVGSDTYNYQKDSWLLTPARRIQLFSTGNWAMGKEVRGFYEASYTNRTSKTNAAPQPVYTTVAAGNPYNEFGVDLPIYRRMVELGPRTFGQEQNTFRVVAGLEGELGAWARRLAGWKWELSYNYGRNAWTDTMQAMVRKSAIAAAAGASCPATGCVDLLHGAGSLSPAQLGALHFDGTAHGLNEMRVLSVSADGSLFTLWANRPVGLAAGADLRRESGGYWPDAITAAGDSADNAQQPVSGSYSTREAYAELSLPLVSQRPGLEDLELSVALRNVDYSTFGDDTTYKLGGRWMPVRDLTLRGTYATAFRAPNIDELFQGSLQSQESTDTGDPCGNPTDPAIQAQCRAQLGKLTGDTNPQVTTLLGGNPNLRPERARTFTAGVVLEPRWLKRFALTADYWDIRIRRMVENQGTQQILNGCYTGDPATSSAADCARIHRDPDTGRIDYVDDTFSNLGTARTSGVDLGARWLVPAHAVGDFRFDVDATYLVRYDRTTADGTVHAAGTYDLKLLLPRWKWNGRVGWQRGPLGLATEARYIGTFKECAGNSCADYPQYARHVRPNLVFDLAASYDLKSTLGESSLMLGVRNVFDSAPPLVFNGADNNSDPGYDYVGRYVWARLTQRF